MGGLFRFAHRANPLCVCRPPLNFLNVLVAKAYVHSAACPKAPWVFAPVFVNNFPVRKNLCSLVTHNPAAMPAGNPRRLCGPFLPEKLFHFFLRHFFQKLLRCRRKHPAVSFNLKFLISALCVFTFICGNNFVTAVYLRLNKVLRLLAFRAPRRRFVKTGQNLFKLSHFPSPSFSSHKQIL